MRLKKRPLYHDHVYSLLDIFALHSSARCIATFAIYMRCSRICRIITDLQKKLILETVQCMYGRVSKVIYCLCTFFFFFLISYTTIWYSIVMFHGFLLFSFLLLRLAVCWCFSFSSRRCRREQVADRDERKEVKRSWKTSKYLSLTVSTCPTIGFQVFFLFISSCWQSHCSRDFNLKLKIKSVLTT